MINFTPTSEERLRLLIAVPDGDFHPKLLDVPVSDKALSAQLYDYGMQAYKAWIDWSEQLEKIFSQTYDNATYTVEEDSKLTDDELEKLGLPDLSLLFLSPLSIPLLLSIYFFFPLRKQIRLLFYLGLLQIIHFRRSL